MRSYLRNIGLALSQIINAVLGGHHAETLSARIGRSLLRAAEDCWLCRVPWPRIVREHFETAARQRRREP